MATQKCPRCGSERVRRGYRTTSLFKKLTFRYNLLCDSCNWEFVGFAVPGTVSAKTKKKRKEPSLEPDNKSDFTERNGEDVKYASSAQEVVPLEDEHKTTRTKKKKAKVKIPS